MKMLMLLAILVVLILIAGCTQQNPPPTGNPNTVTIKNFAFSPSVLTVSSGTTVTWVNEDSTVHTVTSDSGSELNSGEVPSGQSYTHTFNTAGTFSYHCSIHTSMKAQIVVE
jgi:plastocyanin